MIIYLQKEDQLTLEKGTTRLLAKLSWSTDDKKTIFKQAPVDCNLMAALFDESETLIETVDYQYKNSQNTVLFLKDNQNGRDGDEEILIDLTRMSEYINKIIFTVNLYDAGGRKQTLDMAHNAILRFIDQDNGKELFRFDLTDNGRGKEGIVICGLCRKENAFHVSTIMKSLDNAGNRNQLMNGFILPTLKLAI